jgi:hypothetical protein
MELDLQSLFRPHMHSCTRWLRPRNPTHFPPHLGSYTRALLVSQDRGHLFVSLWYDITLMLVRAIYLTWPIPLKAYLAYMFNRDFFVTDCIKHRKSCHCFQWRCALLVRSGEGCFTRTSNKKLLVYLILQMNLQHCQYKEKLIKLISFPGAGNSWKKEYPFQ